MIAEAMMGRGDMAFEYYRALSPLAQNDRAELRHIEPYVYGQFVTGKWDPTFGVAHNPWLTGTASWCYVAATQYILGIRAELNGLRIDPCIPASWDGFESTRIFRGVTYKIVVKNPQHVCRGVKRLTVDGKTVAGNLVPLAKTSDPVRVEVVLGTNG
jgi:cellobiose phosphorylase